MERKTELMVASSKVAGVGEKDIVLNGGETRKFLQDGDTVTIRGWSSKAESGIVGFGKCVGRIKPASAFLVKQMV